MKVTSTTTRHPNMYPYVFIAYGPGAVLKEDAHWRNWRKWSGIAFRLGHRVTWLELRGIPPVPMRPDVATQRGFTGFITRGQQT